MIVKDDFIDTVLMEMIDKLSKQQLQDLKDTLIRVIYTSASSEKNTEISTIVDDTDNYIKKFELSMIVEEKSEKTIKQYVRASKKFFTIIDKNFRDVTSDDALYYMAYMKKYSNYSATSRDNERKFVKGFFNWLFDNEYIYRNPFERIKAVKRDDKKKEILSEEEIELLRDDCKNDVRDLAILDFVLSTGVRVSELANLNINDVNFQTNEVSVYGIKTNTWRTVYLDAKANKHLQDYLSERIDNNTALFVNKKTKKRLSNKSYEDIVRKHAENCNITKHCTIHIFRKTLVSKLYSKRLMGLGEIAQLMGHSVTTLQKYYLLIDDNDVKNSYMQSVS